MKQYARAFSWSWLALSVVEPVWGGPVLMNEIMYHPISENSLEEYIELFNAGTNPVNLAGWRFVTGVRFTFPEVTIAPGAFLVVAANGDADDFARYRRMAHEGVTPQEQLRYLFALARFREPELFDTLVASCPTDEVRPQDAPFLLAVATTNRDLGERAWRFIAEHWDEANERFASSNVITLASGARFLTLPEQQRDVAGFFQTHTIPQAALMLDQILERQRIGVTLRERATPDLEQIFGD